MFKRLPRIHRGLSVKLLMSGVMLICLQQAQAQCNFPNPLKHQRVSGISIGSGFINGMLVYLPPDYNIDPNKEFPVIFFFHGVGAINGGNPVSDSLCKIFTDQPNGLPGRIERDEFPTTVTVDGVDYSYIVISPQYTTYGPPGHYSNEVNELIDYAIDNYRIDTTRIYLTGLSAGSNIALDYVTSSEDNARRIAGASFASTCFETWRAPDGPEIIANSGLATWFLHCESDGNCNVSVSDTWVSEINANSPLTVPRYTRKTDDPDILFRLPYCQGFPHDTWTALYSPSYVPLDAGPNFYTWQLQQSSVLPVVLKSFTARISNGKVYLRWITSSEKDNSAFIVERAGADKPFSAIATINGNGTSAGDKVYEYVDETPLPNLSFYRLKQRDIDGRVQYFQTRKVLNRLQTQKMITITPNPFTTDPAAFIHVDRKQRVSVWITDMSGRILANVNGTYEAGTTELSLPTGELPRGVYLVKVSGEGISETHKIIKQ